MLITEIGKRTKKGEDTVWRMQAAIVVQSLLNRLSAMVEYHQRKHFPNVGRPEWCNKQIWSMRMWMFLSLEEYPNSRPKELVEVTQIWTGDDRERTNWHMDAPNVIQRITPNASHSIILPKFHQISHRSQTPFLQRWSPWGSDAGKANNSKMLIITRTASNMLRYIQPSIRS